AAACSSRASAAPTGPPSRFARTWRSTSPPPRPPRSGSAALTARATASAPAEERLALINLASDLLARGYAGYQGVLAVHAEGSLEAEKMMVFRSYDSGPAAAYGRELAGLAGPE